MGLFNRKFEISEDELKVLYARVNTAEKLSKLHLDNLIKLSDIHKLSISLSAKSLEIIERIKNRYPYIWNECSDENDSLYIESLMKELNRLTC